MAESLEITRTSDIALFGKDASPRIIDVLPLRTGSSAGHEIVRIYRRSENLEEVYAEDVPFYPFFFLSDAAFLKDFPRDRYKIQRLQGENVYKYLVAFNTWQEYWDAIRHIERITENREKRIDEIYTAGSPAQQYLLQSGRTCFKGMAFDDLYRMQLDIETYSETGFPDARRPEDQIIIIALQDNRGWHRLLDARTLSERAMLEELVRIIRERDPDVLEMHNGFAFDLPYIEARCARHGVPFAVGRDGSVPRTYASSIRFA